MELEKPLEDRLKACTASVGLPIDEYARRMIEENVGNSDSDEFAVIDAATSAFAHVPYSSDDLAADRETELEREEAKHAKRFSWQPMP